ncbi:hypothetical protein RIN96_26865, partial [Escherichia coli]|uniref:hypothetical protein n=1 Tax=Escherichia coli TaxID=562 RepID=UPI00285B89B2|nr:hypothetical protein [Escherichia coli]
RLRFSGPKTSIICSPMTSLKTSIKTITYLSDIGCLEIQGASLTAKRIVVQQFGDEPVGWAYDCHIQGNLTTGNPEYEHDILLSSLISGTVENNRLNGESKYSIGIIRHHNTDLIIR